MNCNELYNFLNVKEFIEIKKEKDNDLFNHPVVKKWHEYFMEFWNSDKKIAIILPCTSIKPYSRSATHRLAYALLRKYDLEDVVQVYSVSEPMLLVPRELEECYPFNSYDYPPSLMSKEEKEEFVRLLVNPLMKISRLHEKIVGILPKHHYNVVKRASELSGVKIELYPYGRLVFRTISEVFNSLLKPE
ncbi:hypothetical protein DJ524_07315 [Sulfolobus sp. D5]|nr:hypothetical protein DJ524_07315 [Sulfolobus sp. D5]